MGDFGYAVEMCDRESSEKYMKEWLEGFAAGKLLPSLRQSSEFWYRSEYYCPVREGEVVIYKQGEQGSRLSYCE